MAALFVQFPYMLGSVSALVPFLTLLLLLFSFFNALNLSEAAEGWGLVSGRVLATHLQHPGLDLSKVKGEMM